MWDPLSLKALELLARGHNLYGPFDCDAGLGGSPEQLRQRADRLIGIGAPAGMPGTLQAAAGLRSTADADSELDAVLDDARNDHSAGWHATRRILDDARNDSMSGADTAIGQREALRRMMARLHQQRHHLHRSYQRSQLRGRQLRRLNYLRGRRAVRSGVLPLSMVRYERVYAPGHVRQQIAAALDHLGINDPAARRRWMRGYETLIARESGGRPSVIASDPATAPGVMQPDGRGLGFARGIAQTIPATFARYHQPGTSTNIYDPIANICASMNYVIHRYGVSLDGRNLAAAVQQADAHRPPKGY
ncbi:transglycosylase SLT domain-containing protein [Mycobacterium sp.]|uniref:transglycosylase SLT domain-containing protein n=1 Tax=Mycobacterium sp. TaxID=1785 RepID=UPI003F977C6A